MFKIRRDKESFLWKFLSYGSIYNVDDPFALPSLGHVASLLKDDLSFLRFVGEL